MCKRELTEAELAQVNGGVGIQNGGGVYRNGLNNFGNGAGPEPLGMPTGMPTRDVAELLKERQNPNGQNPAGQNPAGQGIVPDPFQIPGKSL